MIAYRPPWLQMAVAMISELKEQDFLRKEVLGHAEYLGQDAVGPTGRLPLTLVCDAPQPHDRPACCCASRMVHAPLCSTRRRLASKAIARLMSLVP